MPHNLLRFRHSSCGWRPHLIAVTWAGLLAPLSVACGSSDASSGRIHPPVIQRLSPVSPDAVEAPAQPGEHSTADRFHRGGGDDSLYLNRDSFYDGSTGCSVVGGVVSC
jgi:hypothetical protein